MTDTIHAVAVFLCLLGWGAMLYILNMKTIYVFSFRVFAVMMCVVFCLRVLLEFELPETEMRFSERDIRELTVTRSLKARLWAIEFVFMMCEFGVVTSLLLGCTSGLR